MKQEIKIQIRMNPKFKEELEQEARKKGLNLSSYVRMILMERNK